MTQHPDASKDAAFRAVGRTVVNFQRLEYNLKLAARFGPVQGIPQEIERDVARRIERAQTLTLGQAIQAWLALGDDPPAEPAGTPDRCDVSFRTTITWEGAEEIHQAHAAALMDLLKRRNDLVHSRLATFDWASPDACAALVAELDKVNVAIGEQMDYVVTLLTAIEEHMREHAEAMAAHFEEHGLDEPR